MATCISKKIGYFQVVLEIKLNAAPVPCVTSSLSANKLYQIDDLGWNAREIVLQNTLAMIAMLKIRNGLFLIRSIKFFSCKNLKKLRFLGTLYSLLLSTKVRSHKVQRFICVYLCKFKYPNPQSVPITSLSVKPRTPWLDHVPLSLDCFLPTIDRHSVVILLASLLHAYYWPDMDPYLILLSLGESLHKNQALPWHLSCVVKNTHWGNLSLLPPWEFTLWWIRLRSRSNGNVNRKQTAGFAELLWNLVLFT